MNVPVFYGSCVFDIPSEIGCVAPEVPTFRQHIPGSLEAFVVRLNSIPGTPP